MIVKNNTKRYKTKKGGFSAMGMDWAAQQKKQELEMKKKAEGEPDLGYVGAFSGMKCGNLTEVGDRLECHHSKWKYDDPLAKMEVRRKALQRKRKGRHKFAIQRMCMEESPMLCATKDRDDLPKEQEPKCLEVNACPEPGAQLSDIIDDAKEFYKMMIKAFDFGKGKKGKRRKNTKELSKLRKKMKKELEQIKKDYDALKKPSAAKGGAMPQINNNLANEIFDKLSRSTTPIDYMMNGGSMPQINNNLANEIFDQLSRSTTPIDYMMDGGATDEEKEAKKKEKEAAKAEKAAEKAKAKEEKEQAKKDAKEAKKAEKEAAKTPEGKAKKAAEKAQAKEEKKEQKAKDSAKRKEDFSKATGTTGCKNFVGKGVFKDDWKKYKSCVIDMMEGAPKDAKDLIEGAKAKFKAAPLVEEHLKLLEKYKRKKDMMNKTASSASQKLKKLKKKAKGKIAAYKVAGQKAKDGAKKMTKFSKGATKKNIDKLENDPKMKGKAEEMAKNKANKKLADMNKKREDAGLPPLPKKQSEAFLKKQERSEMKKIVSSRGAMKSIKKDMMRNNIKQQASALGITQPLKTSKKTLKKLGKAEEKIEQMEKLKGANGQAIGREKAQAMVKAGLSAKQGKTKAERSLAKAEATKALNNAKLGPMATSIKSVKKMSKAQDKISKKLEKAKEKGASKDQLNILQQSMQAKASTSFLQRKITKRSELKAATKDARQVKRDLKTLNSKKKASVEGYFGTGKQAQLRKDLFNKKVTAAEEKKKAYREALKKGDSNRISKARSELKEAQKMVQATKKELRLNRRKNQLKSGAKTFGKGALRVGKAALTAGQSEKYGRKALSFATLGASRLAQRGLQKAERIYRDKRGLNATKLNQREKKLKEKLGSIGKTYKTAGRGALAVGSLGLSEKRARNAYKKTGKALARGTLAVGSLGLSEKRARNAYVKTGKALGRGALAVGSLGLSEKRARNAYVKTGKALGRGALAVGSLGLSEKRARNAYVKTGKAIGRGALAVGSLGLSEKRARNAYVKTGKAIGRNKMRSLAALGTGGLSEIGRRAYNKTESGKRSKLAQREFKQMRNEEKLKTLNGKARNNLQTRIDTRKKKINKTQEELKTQLAEETKNKRLSRRAGRLARKTGSLITTAVKETGKATLALGALAAGNARTAERIYSKTPKPSTNNKIKKYEGVAKVERDARAKRIAKKGSNAEALQAKVNQQMKDGAKTDNDLRKTQKRAEALKKARRSGNRRNASEILGDEKTASTETQPKKTTRTQKVVSGLKTAGKAVSEVFSKKKNKTATSEAATNEAAKSSNGTKMSTTEMLMAQKSTGTSGADSSGADSSGADSSGADSSGADSRGAASSNASSKATKSTNKAASPAAVSNATTNKAASPAAVSKATTNKAGTSKAVKANAGTTEAATNKAGTNVVANAATTEAATNKAGTNVVANAGTTEAATNKAGPNVVANAATTEAATNKAGTNVVANAGTTEAATNKAGTNVVATNKAVKANAGTNVVATNKAGTNVVATNKAGTNVVANAALLQSQLATSAAATNAGTTGNKQNANLAAQAKQNLVATSGNVIQTTRKAVKNGPPTLKLNGINFGESTTNGEPNISAATNLVATSKAANAGKSGNGNKPKSTAAKSESTTLTIGGINSEESNTNVAGPSGAGPSGSGPSTNTVATNEAGTNVVANSVPSAPANAVPSGADTSGAVTSAAVLSTNKKLQQPVVNKTTQAYKNLDVVVNNNTTIPSVSNRIGKYKEKMQAAQ